MPDIDFPRMVQTNVLFYDAVDILGVSSMKFYFTGGGIRVLFSNDGGISTDNGTYEEYTGTISSGVSFDFSFTTTGQVLRMRVVIDAGAKLYSPQTNQEESDFLWQGIVQRG